MHHLLSLYALGGTPDELQKQYDSNAEYQRNPQPLDESIVDELHDSAAFKKYLDNERYFRDYMVFFQREIEKKGVGEVVNEYLLKGDERANDMLGRTYAGMRMSFSFAETTGLSRSGFLHPIIHLGYGLEFGQPVVVAEALAQAAAHDNWTGDFLLAAEKQAKQIGKPKKSLFKLLEETRADKKLVESPHWQDGNKVRDGILKRAKDEMLNIAGQYVVSEDDLEARTAEMINLSGTTPAFNYCDELLTCQTAYFTCSAQRPPKKVKMDFFLMHAINCSIFFPKFLEQSWLSPANKARLLEWKVRLDLALYVSRASPDLKMDEVRDYQPKKPKEADWQGIFKRVNRFDDDGHANKFVRALANGERVCGRWEGERDFVVKGKDWLQMANMGMFLLRLFPRLKLGCTDFVPSY